MMRTSYIGYRCLRCEGGWTPTETVDDFKAMQEVRIHMQIRHPEVILEQKGVSYESMTDQWASSTVAIPAPDDLNARVDAKLAILPRYPIVKFLGDSTTAVHLRSLIVDWMPASDVRALVSSLVHQIHELQTQARQPNSRHVKRPEGIRTIAEIETDQEAAGS